MFEDQDKKANDEPVEDIFGDVDPVPPNLPGTTTDDADTTDTDTAPQADPASASEASADAGNPGLAKPSKTDDAASEPDMPGDSPEGGDDFKLPSAPVEKTPEAANEPMPESAASSVTADPSTLFPTEDREDRQRGSKSGGFLHILQYVAIGLLVAAIIGLSAFFIIRFLSGDGMFDFINETEEVDPNDSDNEVIEDPLEGLPEENPFVNEEPEPIPEPAPEPEPISEPEPIPEPEENPIDSDGDGLTDAEETRLGTDLYDIDTDNDSLIDYAEVNVYFTDPLTQDTDGDGFTDGEEVRNGYNPTGPGQLFQVPDAK